MEPSETPSKRTPRSIPAELHDTVWRLHCDGLGPQQITEQLTCSTTRHSVRRLVVQLNRIHTRDAHAAAIADELKLARAAALARREMHQETYDDIVDDLAVALEARDYEHILALSRAGRVVARAVHQYDRIYESALDREAQLPKPPAAPLKPEGTPSITTPIDGETLHPAMFYPNGVGVPGALVAMTLDDIPLPEERCSPGVGQWFATRFKIKPGPHTFTARYLGGKGGPPAVVRFTVLGCALFLLLTTVSCGSVKRLATPAPMRASPLSGTAPHPETEHIGRAAPGGWRRLKKPAYSAAEDGRCVRGSGVRTYTIGNDQPASARGGFDLADRCLEVNCESRRSWASLPEAA